MVVRHGHVDVELDVRVVLLGEKHGVKFGLQLGEGGSLCSTLSPALQHDVIAFGRGNRVAYNNNVNGFVTIRLFSKTCGSEQFLRRDTYITSEQLSGFSNRIPFLRWLIRSALEMVG